MRATKDFRELARNVLLGRWKSAVLAGVVAVFLGAINSSGLEIKLFYDGSMVYTGLEFAGQLIFSTTDNVNSNMNVFFRNGFTHILIAILFFKVAYFILGSVIGIGYARFNLNLVDDEKISLDNLFAYLGYWKTAAIARLLQTIYVFLRTFLFIIPGIIAVYSYGMTEYILAEHPELSASEAIARSKEMMEGNKWNLFCLECSFIGWSILCVLTFGIGYLWLKPYKQAAIAAFYREITYIECNEYKERV